MTSPKSLFAVVSWSDSLIRDVASEVFRGPLVVLLPFLNLLSLEYEKYVLTASNGPSYMASYKQSSTRA